MKQAMMWWLASTPGWGAVKLRQLTESMKLEILLECIDKAKDPEQFLLWAKAGWALTRQGMMGVPFRITGKDVDQLRNHGRQRERLYEEYESWTQKGLRFIPWNSSQYPRRLLEIYDPPFALYVQGALPEEDRPTAAVIGARACSGYGAGYAKKTARELAEYGVQIISGLAYGIDSEGHKGALESGVQGATYAVLGCGPDRIYPTEHEPLAQKILEMGGGLISEYPPGTEIHPGHFPMRNRIISGLSDCILVMEARKRSGSLITVDQALEQGREVFALPGRIGEPLSEGCLHLIKNGANVLLTSREVLEFLGMPEGGQDSWKKENNEKTKDKDLKGEKNVGGNRNGEKTKGKESQNQRRNLVYSCLDSVGKSLEEIMELTGLPLKEVQMELLELLLEGQILEPVKGFYTMEL